MIKNFSINSIENLEKSLYDFKILFAFHSNKIENDNVRFCDVVSIFKSKSVTGYTGDLRTLYEIENQVHCYNYLKAFIVDKKSLDIEFIKKIHYKLTRGTYDEVRYNVKEERPGEFKKHDYITGINEVGSSSEDVEQDLTELLDEINSYQGNDYFTVGVYLHAMFENIHPFADGNGRVGRTLMNYYFMIHNIAPVIIYNEDKKLYYEALEMFDNEDGELEPLKKFVEYEQEKTWNKAKKSKKGGLSNFL